MRGGIKKGEIITYGVSRGTGKSVFYMGGSGTTQSPPAAPKWDPWRRTTSLIPRKSISGRWIVGRIQKRGKTVRRMTPTKGGGAMRNKRMHEFATDKQLFEWKLKNGSE